MHSVASYILLNVVIIFIISYCWQADSNSQHLNVDVSASSQLKALISFGACYTERSTLQLKLHLFDLLRICCTTSCTTCRKVVDLMWICRYSFSICATTFRFVVYKSKAILHCLDCCGFSCRVHNKSITSWQVERLWICRKVEKLWICCTTCCTTVRISGVWALAGRPYLLRRLSHDVFIN
jgi:hypothetical protein